jgi:acetylornithine deacetylase/succinyl-diaminopimelate desuccinylase family protein
MDDLDWRKAGEMIERTKIQSLIADLVKIESINPDLVVGGSGEEKIARFVADYLAGAGLKSAFRECAPAPRSGARKPCRANAVGILKGSGGGRTLMFNGHLDTVGIAGMSEPFSGRAEGGRLYGRGAQDMKGGIAAALVAIEALARGSPLKGDVVFAGVADEEFESKGTRALLEEFRADAAVIMEPTGLEVVTAHKGFVWAEVRTLGRAAHGSRPEEGLDAIAFMGRVLAGVEQLENDLRTRRHPMLGPGSIHASTILGGQELSSYPAECRLRIERRLLPGEDAKTFERELQEILIRLSGADENFRAEVQMGYSAEALETPWEASVVKTLMASARKIIGPRVKLGAQSYWTDAALLSRAGIPSILFGPGGNGLHSAEEYVVLEDVALAAEVLIECAREFCNAPDEK